MYTPRDICSSSFPFVITFIPLFPIIIAVPVSWHPGNIFPEAIFAFFNNSNATNLSLLDASGSSKIFLNCYKCPGRKKWEISNKALYDKSSIPLGSTYKKS